MALASISVDVDTLSHYFGIHGLPPELLEPRMEGLVYGTALERFLSLFERLELPGTLFVIGEDLVADGSPPADAGRLLRRAVGLGLEVGNHSHTHPYALTRLDRASLAAEVTLGAQAIERVVGVRPRGFRAPGYTLSPTLLSVLVEEGYAYDSSVFPAAPYWLAKAAVMTGMRLMGRRSRALLDRPHVLFAPRLPYRPEADEPYRAGALPLVELPISVERRTRWPLIGPTVTLLPRRVVDGLYRSWRRDRFLNFELHALDLLGAEDGLPPALVRRQPDLRVPVQEKLTRIGDLFSRLKEDFELVPLLEAARRLAPSLG